MVPTSSGPASRAINICPIDGNPPEASKGIVGIASFNSGILTPGIRFKPLIIRLIGLRTIFMSRFMPSISRFTNPIKAFAINLKKSVMKFLNPSHLFHRTTKAATSAVIAITMRAIGIMLITKFNAPCATVIRAVIAFWAPFATVSATVAAVSLIHATILEFIMALKTVFTPL